MARYIFYNRGRLRSISASFQISCLEQPRTLQLCFHRFANIEKRRFNDRISRDEDQVRSALDRRNQRRYCLSHAPFYAVSHNRVSNLFTDRETDLCAGATVFRVHQRKKLSSARFADTVGIAKLFFPSQGITVLHATASLHQSSHRSYVQRTDPSAVRQRLPVLGFGTPAERGQAPFSKYKHAASKCPPQALVRSFTVLIRKIPLRAENFAAFRAPTLDDIAAICRLHTFTESVDLAPLTFLGLIGSKHSNTPRFAVQSSRRLPAKIAHAGSCPHDMNLMYYSGRRKAVSRSFLSFVCSRLRRNAAMRAALQTPAARQRFAAHL